MFVSATSILAIALCKYNLFLNIFYLLYVKLLSLSFIIIIIIIITIIYSFLLAKIAADQKSLFMLPIGLCEWKLTNVQHPILTNVFKNILKKHLKLKSSKHLRIFFLSLRLWPAVKSIIW